MSPSFVDTRFARRYLLVIEVLALPITVPLSVLFQGLPDTWDELKSYPRDVVRRWRE